MVSRCIACGACCATYRVVFPLAETDQASGRGVPVDLTEQLNARLCCMLGTRQRPRRCVALQGTVGERVACSIYARRPGACRAFAPNAAADRGDMRCGDARRLHGLPPLGGSYDAVPLA